MSHASVLKNVYLFKSFKDDELNKLAKIVEEKTFTPGEDIFVAGQKAESFFVVRMGTVKIYANPDGEKDMVIANLGSGSHFGEVPILDGGSRTATAQAVESTTVLEIPYEKLRQLIVTSDSLSSRFFQNLSMFLAARLRTATENIKQARDVRLKHF